MVWPALAVKAQESSVEVTVVPPGDPTGMSVFADESGRVRDVLAPECDVLVLQRPTFPQIAQAVPVLRAKGIAVVVDIDDDLSAINPANPAYAAMHPNPSSLLDPGLVAHMKRRGMEPKQGQHTWTAVKDACAAATLTTVSTPALVSRYGSGNGRVLYNYIPEAALKISRVDSAVVGWAGSTHSHPGDLKAMGSSIAQLLRRGGEFMVVGDGTDAARDLGLPEPVPQTGQIEFRHWHSAVAQIGVGVAPLLDTRFNEAKSWWKILEYSAAGVPWVASPRAEYRRLHEMGCGALAEKPKDWLRELRRLTTDEAYRAERSEEARAVAATMTIQLHAWRWVEAWRDAFDIQQGRVPAISKR